MELTTLVIYDIEDDWARTRVSEACKDFGLERIQYSCFRGQLSRNKRGELYERFRKIQRSWESRWRKDFPESRIQMSDSPDIPDQRAVAKWHPAFKILIQPLCEKDIRSASYPYLFVDVIGLTRKREDE
ncbi:MAG: CRISPR-associated endonuclease Cas2 [Blastocatellia bacterium AA13]|nr:MAG: CRISPR-associated endonuclease Cas2 [Blastocatellia bacterium AA13]